MHFLAPATVSGLLSLALAVVPTWFEQRMLLAHEYRELGQALEIDRQTESKLVDVLVKYELQRRQRAVPTSFASPEDSHKDMQARADLETAQMAELRKLLGAEKLERFVDFKVSLTDRPFVNGFERQLEPAQKLKPLQREQLVALYRDHRAHELDYSAAISSVRPIGLTLPDDLAQRYMIAGEELIFRNWPQSTQRLLLSAAAVLSPPQLAVLERVHAGDKDLLRIKIEDDRARAGLVRTIPAQWDIDIPRIRSPVTSDIKLTVEVIVDGKPTRFTHQGSNNAAVTFPIAQGLLMEAQPVLFDDDGFDVRLWCYETHPAGKRLIATDLRDSGVSHAMEMPPSLERQGASMLMIAGRKGYVLRYNSVVEAVAKRN